MKRAFEQASRTLLLVGVVGALSLNSALSEELMSTSSPALGSSGNSATGPGGASAGSTTNPNAMVISPFLDLKELPPSLQIDPKMEQANKFENWVSEQEGGLKEIWQKSGELWEKNGNNTPYYGGYRLEDEIVDKKFGHINIYEKYLELGGNFNFDINELTDANVNGPKVNILQEKSIYGDSSVEYKGYYEDYLLKKFSTPQDS